MKFYKLKESPLSKFVWFNVNQYQAMFNITEWVLKVGVNLKINVDYSKAPQMTEIGLSPDQMERLNHCLDLYLLGDYEPDFNGYVEIKYEPG